MKRLIAVLAAAALLSGCAGVFPVPSDGAPLKIAS